MRPPNAPTSALLAALTVAGGCRGADTPPGARGPSQLEASLRSIVEGSPAEVGLYYRSLAPGGDSVAIGADTRMHAASTMKVPVMMRLFLDDQEGVRPLDSELEVTRTFHSIVDGSPFDLPADSDSDTTFYARVGERAPVREMIDRMITWSSNLATNILIEQVDAKRVTALLRELGADSMEVLRGVEDLKAFEAGLSNTATARDLGLAMAAVQGSERFSAGAREEMLSILERQHFREKIPAGLPEGTRVANKTGWIIAHDHDAAVVFPEGAPPYVLVVMVRGIEDRSAAAALIAELSRRVWAYHTEGA